MTRLCVIVALLFIGSDLGYADPSLECSVGSGSQIEISNCLVQVQKTADLAMEQILGFVKDSAAELDRVTERETASTALNDSQAAWVVYRDAQCAYAGSLFGGGSGTGIEILSCQIELTRERTKLLEISLH